MAGLCKVEIKHAYIIRDIGEIDGKNLYLAEPGDQGHQAICSNLRTGLTVPRAW